METTQPPARYRDDRFDSARWRDFPMRPGDIVVSAPAKAGTTWLQTICALLVHQRTGLPAALDDLSPWLDLSMAPVEAVRAQLDLQAHRRIIKTHTPLDGLPLRGDVTYVVAARHPLDVAVSTFHQWRNIDLIQVRAALGVTTAELPDPADIPLGDWLARWIDEQVEDPRTDPHCLQSILWHVTDAWHRREQPNVVLVHYADLSDDLSGQMRRLAGQLGIDVPDGSWRGLVDAATFPRMKADADKLVPRVVPFKDRSAFFREGRSGAGARALGEEGVARFRQRAATLAPADVLDWLCRP